MTDDNETTPEARPSDSQAGEQTSRLRAELSARREASEIVAEANRISEQAAAEAESMVAEAESLAASLVDEARQRAESTLAEASAEAEQLRSGLAEERARVREEVAAEVRAEMSELRTRVERLLGDIGGSLADLGSLLSGAHSTVQRVQRTADGLALAEAELEAYDGPPTEVQPPVVEAEDVAEAVAVPERETGTRDDADADVETETEAVTGQGDREPVVAGSTEESSAEPEPGTETVVALVEEPEDGSRDSLYAVTALHGAARDEQPAGSKDDLEEAPSDPRPLGWLFRGH